MIDNSGTRHARGCPIAARERPRAGSKQMATYEAVAQTQSSCLIAARGRPRAVSKQMATYQAVAQTQSSSSSSNLCCLVATGTQTWPAHVARSLLHTTRCPLCINKLLLCGAHIHSVEPKLRCCYCCTYLLAHAAAACLLHVSLCLYLSHLCFFYTRNKLAKLKGLLRGQPNGRRKYEPQRVFFSVRYYEV